MKKHQFSRAFTLIELLVVIAIIGILTAIVITNLATSRAKARDAKRVSDLGQIQLALELYFDRCKQYPAFIAGTPGSGTGSVTLNTSFNNNCPSGVSLGTYISQIPKDSSGANYDYYVDNMSGPSDYILHATLEYPNSAVQNGLDSSNLPSWASGMTPPPTCSNASNSTNYCLGPK